jgi:hypothetical protein
MLLPDPDHNEIFVSVLLSAGADWKCERSASARSRPEQSISERSLPEGAGWECERRDAASTSSQAAARSRSEQSICERFLPEGAGWECERRDAASTSSQAAARSRSEQRRLRGTDTGGLVPALQIHQQTKFKTASTF